MAAHFPSQIPDECSTCRGASVGTRKISMVASVSRVAVARASTVIWILLIALVVVPVPVHARRSQRRVWVPVLIYHHVTRFKPTDDAIERGLTITPVQFGAELNYLAEHHYQTVSAARVVMSLRTGRRLPTHAVVLTFDDGYADVYRNVYQALRRRHMTATFFIPTGLVGKPRYLTWWQVREMSRHGMDIEAHTVTHPDLTLVSRAQSRGEIYGSRQMLQARLHRAVRVLAYPYGTYNAYLIRTLRQAGFLAAFTTRQGWWQRASHLFTLPRVYVDNDDTLQIFAGRLVASPAILAEDPT